MTAHEVTKAPEFAQITHPWEMTPDLRQELIDCWVAVSNAGGAVIPHGVPLPPVSAQEIGPALDPITQRLDPQHSRLLIATVEGALAGWLLLHRDQHPLVAHCGVVNHVQTPPASAGWESAPQ
ncbi:hypothetical protein ACH4TQ_12105 [Streptomyces sp. NPDC021218]|uniref:hypothetical protein n=1 Tax=unclassified Streptomyces TaxID=2593676 RepID=UPI003681F321